MNIPPRAIDDELISAWVDGELDPAERLRVQDWLQAHPEAMAKAQAWSADRQLLATALGRVLDEAPPPGLRAAAGREPAAADPPRWALAAAAAGLLVAGTLIGAGGAWLWQDQRYARHDAALRSQLAAGTAQGWVQRAAFAHSVYVAEPRHAVEVRAQEEHLARWLTRRIDIPVKLFDLHDQGFELVGGRLLPDGPGKSAQLMYQDAQQRRLTVYLRKPGQASDTAFRYEQQGSLGMFYWIEAGAGYALLGELPKPTLLAIAQSIYRQHPGALPAAPATPAPAAPVSPPASAPPATTGAARPG